jgi:hypothetical protein
LNDVLSRATPSAPETDLVVTTATHYEVLSEKLAGGRRPVRVVMAVTTDSAVAIAKIPASTKLGVLCASERFSQLIGEACERYCRLDSPIRTAYFGNKAEVSELLSSADKLLLPTRCEDFASTEEKAMLEKFTQAHSPIEYHYEIERGSYISLEDRIKGVWQSKRVM